jgi:hypothetical protein
MNTKMKVLALALLGLAGYAGSAVAGCPSSPVPPWSAVDALGGTATIVAGGFAGTPCRLDSALTGDATSFATVEDDTPAAEPRYRAQFIIKPDNLANMGLVTAVYIFTTSASAGGTAVALSIVGDGAGGWLVSYNVPDTTAAGGADVGSFPLTAGENHVEFDLQNGSGGHFSIWVNNNVEGSPNFTTSTFDNGASVVDTAFLGLAGATPDYFASFNGTTVGFDQFDSRRQTFIGF